MSQLKSYQELSRQGQACLLVCGDQRVLSFVVPPCYWSAPSFAVHSLPWMLWAEGLQSGRSGKGAHRLTWA